MQEEQSGFGNLGLELQFVMLSWDAVSVPALIAERVQGYSTSPLKEHGEKGLDLGIWGWSCSLWCQVGMQ